MSSYINNYKYLSTIHRLLHRVKNSQSRVIRSLELTTPSTMNNVYLKFFNMSSGQNLKIKLFDKKYPIEISQDKICNFFACRLFYFFNPSSRGAVATRHIQISKSKNPFLSATEFSFSLFGKN